MGWLLLPASARPYASKAEHALRGGAGRDELWPLLDATIANTPNDAAGCEAAMDFYKRMLRISRYRDESCPLLAPVLLEHLRTQPRSGLYADAAAAHLATAEAVARGDTTSALSLLASLRAEAVPLTGGSFDIVIQHAARARDRRTAYASYRELRRSRLRPSAYTLNALMNTETRCGRPQAALDLLSRADRGAPRWPGEAPDAWSFGTGMAAAAAARRYLKVNQLFQRVTTDVRLRDRVTPAAYNLAVEARVRLSDREGAVRLLKKMSTGADGAPAPSSDTFNALLKVCAEKGTRYSWVLSEMAACDVQPDVYTCCQLLKLQSNLNDARGVWRWSRKRGAARGVVAWHHLIEAHVRYGQPQRASALLQLMEARDGLAPRSTSSHNLYLRALVADGQAAMAMEHFERMCASSGNAVPMPSEECKEEEEAKAEAKAEGASEHGGDAGDANEGEKRPLWLRRPPPPTDAYSYSIALTAMREVSSAEARQRGGRFDLRRAAGFESGGVKKVTRLVEQAEARGLWKQADGNPLPAAVAHALVCACGDDIRAAVTLWRDHLRPRMLSSRNADTPLYNPAGQQPTAEQAAYHALLRVCGAAGRPDEALRIVYAMKRDGFPADGSCHSAYFRGKDSAKSTASSLSGVQAVAMLQGGYEQLLALELAPERVDGPKLGGKIDKIRIKF